MELQGKFVVKRPCEAVYRFLIDPERFGKILPDLKSLEVLSPTSFTAVFSVGISFIRGDMEVRFDLIESRENREARFKGKGLGIGSFVELETGFQLNPDGEGTEVSWRGVAQIGGRLAAAAGGLLQPVAAKNANVFIAALKAQIERTV